MLSENTSLVNDLKVVLKTVDEHNSSTVVLLSIMKEKVNLLTKIILYLK